MKRLFIALERRTLNLKLAIAFVLMMGGIIAVGLEGLLSQSALRGDLEVIYEQELKGIANAKDVQIAYLTIARTIRQMLIAPDAGERERAFAQHGEFALLFAELSALFSICHFVLSVQVCRLGCVPGIAAASPSGRDQVGRFNTPLARMFRCTWFEPP